MAIQVDADGQHDPRYVPKLVDLLDETDPAAAPTRPAPGVRAGSYWTLAKPLLKRH
ncbi:hypothetical protein ACFYPX_17790 [Micromonospora zamorensis]|uniref:hypothetical protein n=1 Tax=Micromonospora zamorensis TaxID=709883 RepID=UPI0036C49B8F